MSNLDCQSVDEAKLLYNLGYQSALVSIPPRINDMF